MIRFHHGTGKPLLLIHGLGGTWRSWMPILPALIQSREVISIDLPGHGAAPVEADSGTFAGLVDSVSRLIDSENLDGIDMAGSSLGGRIVLELARRGGTGAAIALDPGGFWQGWESGYFRTSLLASGALLRAVGKKLPALGRNPVLRSLALIQLSRRAWSYDPDFISSELIGLTRTATYDALVHDLAGGPAQTGSADIKAPVVIGWGRNDRLCFPWQARRALEAFPTARIYRFEDCGHFPMWDQPEETARLILGATTQTPRPAYRAGVRRNARFK